MSCDEVRALFSALVDEALTPAERAEIDRHLAACPECARELDRFGRTVALLRGVERARAPVGFVDRAMAEVRRTPWHRRLARWLAWPRPAQLPVSLAATAVIAGLTAYLYQHVPELRDAAKPEVQRVEPLVGVPAEPPGGRDPMPGADPRLMGRPATPPALPGTAPPGGREDGAPPAVRSRAPTATQQGARGESSPHTPASERDAVARELADRALSAERRVSDEQQRRVAAERRESESVTARAPAPSSPMSERPDAAEREASGPVSGETLAKQGPPAPRQETPSAPTAVAARMVRPPDLTGRLAAPDPSAALSALERLAAELGATALGRRQEPGATVVELRIPRSAFARLEPGLRGIGAWTRETGPGGLPEMVHVVIRLTP